jgi:putative ABC transport system permease protein
VLLGTILAANMGKRVGDQLMICGQGPYKVRGVYQTNNVLMDGMLVMCLGELQRLMDRSGQVTGFGISLEETAEEADIERVKDQLEDVQPGLKVLAAQDHVRSITQFKITRAMSWITGAIAFLIGTVSMLNTMFMSVTERTHEIGVLRAIGWRRSRVVRMILWESACMSLLAAVLGSALSIFGLFCLTRFPLVNGLISGEVPLSVISEGFVLALGLGVIGAAYPAWLAANLPPSVALRHE